MRFIQYTKLIIRIIIIPLVPDTYVDRLSLRIRQTKLKIYEMVLFWYRVTVYSSSYVKHSILQHFNASILEAWLTAIVLNPISDHVPIKYRHMVLVEIPLGFTGFFYSLPLWLLSAINNMRSIGTCEASISNRTSDSGFDS